MAWVGTKLKIFPFVRAKSPKIYRPEQIHNGFLRIDFGRSILGNFACDSAYKQPHSTRAYTARFLTLGEIHHYGYLDYQYVVKGANVLLKNLVNDEQPRYHESTAFRVGRFSTLFLVESETE